jgi:preprotein translocase subunit SecG
MGIRKTADFLEKSTWTLAGAILILCVVATGTIPRGATAERSRIENQIQNAVDPSAIPTLPTAVPTDQPANTQSGSEQKPKN